MPSAHTAFAISLLMSIGYFEGVHTGSFAVAFALAFVIIDDAARIRMHLRGVLNDRGCFQLLMLPPA